MFEFSSGYVTTGTSTTELGLTSIVVAERKSSSDKVNMNPLPGVTVHRARGGGDGGLP